MRTKCTVAASWMKKGDQALTLRAPGRVRFESTRMRLKSTVAGDPCSIVLPRVRRVRREARPLSAETGARPVARLGAARMCPRRFRTDPKIIPFAILIAVVLAFWHSIRPHGGGRHRRVAGMFETRLLQMRHTPRAIRVHQIKSPSFLWPQARGFCRKCQNARTPAIRIENRPSEFSDRF